MPRKPRPFVTAESLELDAWLSLVLTPDYDRKVEVEDYRFPTADHAKTYLESVAVRSEHEVRSLLRLMLMPGGRLGADNSLMKGLIARGGGAVSDFIEGSEFGSRLLRSEGPWQGLTWVLDLLPRHAREAIDVVNAYYIAHAQVIPDGRADGLEDACLIIRQRFIQFENRRDALESLTPQEFEYLIAALYQRMGYSVALTRQSADGGVDVIAEYKERGQRSVALIQCKHYTKNVRVHPVRELAGVVLRRHANKGVLVSSSDFTRAAKQEAQLTNTIELVGYQDLNVLLNQHLGVTWPSTATYFINSMKHQSRVRSDA